VSQGLQILVDIASSNGDDFGLFQTFAIVDEGKAKVLRMFVYQDKELVVGTFAKGCI
jgi:hypothetical protein